MEPLDREWFKTRKLRFATDANGAALAIRLADLDGVESVVMSGDNQVQIRYDLRIITLRSLESEVAAALHPLNLAARLFHRLIHAREAIQRDQRRMETGWNNYLRTAYVSRYRHGRHGRRDDRPQQWREYVASPQPDRPQ